MTPQFFIRRPRFALVISVLITLLGVLAGIVMPVDQYPDIAAPKIVVRANYPGASAQTVKEAVAAPIEEEVNGAEGMVYMSSKSASDGSYTLTVTFGIDLFQQYLDFIALRTAFPGKTGNEIWHLTTRLLTVPKQKQVWKLVDMAHRTLTKLKARGFALGIVSNFDETLPELCDQFELTRYFDAIVVSSIAGVEKPDPEILHIACQRLEVSPLVSLYVGDHPFDVLCAKKAGMSVAWLCEPGDVLPKTVPHEPDYRIQSLADLVVL